MKIFKITSLALFLVLFLVSSCTKDDEFDNKMEEEDNAPDPIETTEENALLKRANSNTSSSNEATLDFDCISIEYPFDVVDDGGNSYTLEDNEDYEVAIFDSALFIVDFSYPIIAINETGEIVSIDSGEELGELFASCIPNVAWNEDDFPAFLIDNVTSCLTFDYSSLKLKDEQGNEHIIENEEDFIETISEQFVFFVYPFNLISTEGDIWTIGDTDALFDALATCNGLDLDSLNWDYESDFELLGCYEIAFPFNVLLSDGTETIVENHMELCDLIVQGQLLDYVYPLTLTDVDGNTVVIGTQLELYDKLNSCYDFGGDDYIDFGDDYISFDTGLTFLIIISNEFVDNNGNPLCLDVNYPVSIQITDFGGNVEIVEIVNAEEAIVAQSSNGFVELLYPIEAVRVVDQETILIESNTQIIEESEKCL